MTRRMASAGTFVAALSLAFNLVVMAAPASAQTGSSGALPWLGVRPATGSRPQITDSAGRTVILRGVNAVGLEDDFYRTANGSAAGPSPFWPVAPSAYAGTCPANSSIAGEPPVCEVQAGLPAYQESTASGAENDLAQMRALGFDVVRLPVSWSLLEPSPGVYDSGYLDRIAQVVGWAQQQGIYVLIDMHQDDYSRFTPESAPLSAPPLAGPTSQSANHADGAPPWAVLTDGVPAEAVAGQSPLNVYVEAAFTSFWLNRVPTDPKTGSPLPQGQAPGPGLQDHYIGAIAQLAKRFENDSTVAGYELMNEPLPGVIPFPGPFDQGYLFPFYRRAIDAVTGVHDGIACPPGTSYGAACGYPSLGIGDRRHLIFFEPMVVRNETDLAVGLSAPFSSYRNLVYAPHAYTHVFTVDTQIPGGQASGAYPVSYDQAIQTADAEARLMHASLLIGEYGNAAADDVKILAGETAAQDRASVGSTLWAWKANCRPASSCWSMYAGAWPAQNGALIGTRQRFVSRVYPRATEGTLRAFSYDPLKRSFSMTASARRRIRPGDLVHETIVYIPSSVPGAVAVGGAAVLDQVLTEPDGSRLAYVAPSGAGSYTVAVG